MACHLDSVFQTQSFSLRIPQEPFGAAGTDPVGKPVSAKEEEAMFIMCNNWVALSQQEVRSKGHVCPVLLPILNEH